MVFSMQHVQNLRRIFRKSVEAVHPKNLLSANNNNINLKPQNDRNGNYYLDLGTNKLTNLEDKRINVVGFGKAVLGMAVQFERTLGPQCISEGIISIPKGTVAKFRDDADMVLDSQSKIRVIEGAPNNQYDESAHEAAKAIHALAQRMTEKDILFVLISGGGSALLPLPKEPLTLQDKLDIVRRLVSAGADINEMNVVRIALSGIKGGRLALAAKNAHVVISVILSDIVSNPMDLIASGPTYVSSSGSQNPSPRQILEKYRIWPTIPPQTQELLQAPLPRAEDVNAAGNNYVYLVGTNAMAAEAACREACNFQYEAFVGTTTLEGNVQDVAEGHIQFLEDYANYRQGNIDEKEFQRRFPFNKEKWSEFLGKHKTCSALKRPMLIICAGEPTVVVGDATGIGGRNQELALLMSQAIYQKESLRDVVFLSGGTDGIDGPTPAAGAFACYGVLHDFLTQCGGSLEKVNEYIIRHDSYTFYSALKNSDFHLIIGHTGTNVMDLQLLLVPLD